MHPKIEELTIMGIKFPALSCLLVLITTSFVLSSVAKAETPDYQTTDNAFERAYFSYDSTFYGNTSLERQVGSLIGIGRKFGAAFPDNEIAKDGESVNKLYHDALSQQATNDPYIRTPDLPNPYNSSLLMTPRYNANQLKVGTEYRFKNLPPR
jgi:hypothetical protein